MTNRPAKSEGMSWLTPMFTVKDMRNALDFYAQAFGFEKTFEMAGEGGNLMHAEMKYRGHGMMFGPEWPQSTSRAPAHVSGTTTDMYLYTDDIEAAFKRATEAGARVVMEIKDQFWGDRTFMVECPEGHKWMFAQNVADYDPNNVPR
jgi:PhnB protein